MNSTPREATRKILAKMRKTLKEHPEGLWIDKIAKECGASLGSVYYFVFGQFKGKEFYGGYLKNEVEDISNEKEGRNRKIRMKVN